MTMTFFVHKMSWHSVEKCCKMKIDKKGFTEYDQNVLRLCVDNHIDRKAENVLCRKSIRENNETR